MDGLLAEINTKRKALVGVGGDAEAGPSKKYMRRADVERAQDEEEQRKKDERAAILKKEKEDRASKLRKEVRSSVRSLQSTLTKQADPARSKSLAIESSPRSTPEPPPPIEAREAFNISVDEAIRRLRQKGQPIRLFGETDKDRRLRLRALELLEKSEDTGRRDDFGRLYEAMESGMAAREMDKKAKAEHAKAAATEGKKDEERADIGVLDLSLIRTNPNKLYPLLYYGLKVGRVVRSAPPRLKRQNVLREWEEWMDTRPGESFLCRTSQLILQTRSSGRLRANSRPPRKYSLRRV